VILKPGLARPAIFGSFDGTATLLGVVLYLLLTHPALIFPTAVSGALSSAVSMGGGEWLSDDTDNGFAASAVMALATFAGAILPAVPFAFSTGPGAIGAFGMICLGIGAVVALLRAKPQPGKPRRRSAPLALAETYGILAAVAVVVLVCSVFVPASAG
jgi:hypothetical protein